MYWTIVHMETRCCIK